MKYLIIFFFFCVSLIINAQENYRLNINNINLPFDNKGVLADVNIPPDGSGGRYDSIVFLFSGGFFLTGINADTIWANAVATASLVNDYQPGPVGSLPGNPENKIYVIQSSDPPFGQSWQDYSDAVNLGADFYDGNNDGLYNPVDLNGNNQWDPEEDRPDILGDVTAWCVYNDGVPANLRRFIQDPLGIELQQTIFAFTPVTSQFLDNTIFIRYRITNTGNISSILDSVYFSAWSDPDIGDATNDMFGTDSLLNSGYSYQLQEDFSYGINPPAFFTTILQGPYAYIPGVTFIDVNSNGLYDEGTDTPLDSAINNKGTVLGQELFPGAGNLNLKSSMMHVNGDPFLQQPNDHFEARNYSLGKLKDGDIIDPCNFQYGYYQNVNCNEVNPFKIFSGDPVSETGWLCRFEGNIFTMINSGPFKLEADKPVDIIVAYNVGRGVDTLDSIIKGRAVTRTSIDFYNSNFSDLAVIVTEDFPLPSEFELYQNYPNPFNPATSIQYSVGSKEFVTLKVYDILGREVAALVNEEKPSGTYEVQFDASSLSSGIYFYEMRAGNFSSVQKMILMK